MDQTNDGPSPSEQDNFTSPLPPTARPSSPLATMQQEQTEEMERVGKGVEGCDGESSTAGTVEVETSVKVCEENEEGEKQTGAEGEVDSSVPDPPLDPQATISAEEPAENSTSPEPPQQIQRQQPSTEGPQISRWDKTIIEKIRSYYEAAAKAEEGDDEEEELREGAWCRRRKSISEIPSGLVKDSVSQFDVGEHQWEQRSKAQNCPPAPPSPESSDPPVRPLDLLLDAGPSAGVAQDQKNPDQGGSVREEEIARSQEKVHPPEGGLQEEEEKGEEAPSNQNQGRTQTGPGNPAVHEANKAPAAEPFREAAERSGSRRDPSWTRTGHRDPAAAHRSSARTQAASCSQQSRTGRANRVLFEATASDLAGIGLFPAGPVVDPVLMENSERILSRVQTLALMYSTKAGSMKLRTMVSSSRPGPRHQNRLQAQSQSPPEEQLRSEGGSKYGTHTKVQHQHQPQNQTRTGSPGQDRADGTQGQARVDGTRTHSQDRVDGRCHLSDQHLRAPQTLILVLSVVQIPGSGFPVKL